jgi:anti-sigma B factor antagonist
MHGYEPGEFEPTTELILSHKHPDDLARVKSLLQQSVAPFSSRHRIRTTTGEIRKVVVVGDPVNDADGRIVEPDLALVSLAAATGRNGLSDRLVTLVESTAAARRAGVALLLAGVSVSVDRHEVRMGKHSSAADGADAFLRQDELDVEEYWLDQVVVVAAAGVVDMLTAPRLTEAISVAAAKSPAGVIVDLSKVDFLASAGITVLVAAHAKVTPNARFGVVADGPATSRPITLLGIEITLYRTLQDALDEINTAGA